MESPKLLQPLLDLWEVPSRFRSAGASEVSAATLAASEFSAPAGNRGKRNNNRHGRCAENKFFQLHASLWELVHPTKQADRSICSPASDLWKRFYFHQAS